MLENIQCKECKKIFVAPYGRHRTVCSLKCNALWNTKHIKNFGFKIGNKPKIKPKIYKSWRIIRKTTGNPAWKGDKASISSIHCWVRDNWKKKRKCELCQSIKAKSYDWSNKNHAYSRERKDWWVLCRSCHIKWDIKYNNLYNKRYNADKNP